jgi:GTPase SAR1 family protein
MSSAVTSKNFQSGDKVDCRIVVLGAAGAGKSSLSKVFITGEFPKNYIPTLSDTLTKQVEFHKETITVEILDTAGSEQFEDGKDDNDFLCHFIRLNASQVRSNGDFFSA